MAVYWGAACGGCCVSVLDVHEHLFDIIDAADLVFWPIALDINAVYRKRLYVQQKVVLMIDHLRDTFKRTLKKIKV